MDEIYQKLGSGILNLWPDSGSSTETSFDVTEAWLHHGSGKIKTKERRITSDNLESWLAEERTENENGTQSLVLRLAFVDVDVQSQIVELSGAVKNQLLDHFDLKLAYRYAKSCITNATTIPPSNGHQTYSFCYLPKLAAVWSHRRFDVQTPADRPYLTQGIIFVQKPQKKSTERQKQQLSQLLTTPWDNCLYGNAMFPALLFSLLLSAQIHMTDESIKHAIRGIESQTGHHLFESRPEDGSTQEYSILAAHADGCATKLASVNRKSRMVERVLKFMLENIQEEERVCCNASLPYPDACQFMRNHVGVLQQRLEMQSVDSEFTLKRVQVQTTVLAGMISREDAKANKQLAEAQREIAMHSYRDSSSMKTLAIVTMFFLPGSFISALFSTSMFAWDSVDPSSSSMELGTKPQFKLYWVITIPLTATTFLLYFVWLSFMKRQTDHRMSKVLYTKQSDFDKLSVEEKGEKEADHLPKRGRIGTVLTFRSWPWG